MKSIGIIFSSAYHTKQLNLWPNSSASYLKNYSWPSVCPGEMEPVKDHLSTCGYLTSLRNKPQRKLTWVSCALYRTNTYFEDSFNICKIKVKIYCPIRYWLGTIKSWLSQYLLSAHFGYATVCTVWYVAVDHNRKFIMLTHNFDRENNFEERTKPTWNFDEENWQIDYGFHRRSIK